MDEKHVKRAIQAAVDSRCRSLQPNPFLAQKIMGQIQEKGEIKMKKKLSFGLILTIILLLLSISALAVSLLSGTEIVEQKAVSMALENDGDAIPTETFSQAELEQLVQFATENGLQLKDDSNIMQALRNGEGYWEEEAIMDICREAFGGLYYEWTVEQRHWYGDMMVEIGFWSENRNSLPGDGQMPSEEARALALQLLQAESKTPLPLEDEAIYRTTEEFDESGWRFSFLPKNLIHPECHVAFDHQGKASAPCTITPQVWETYTEQDLINAISNRYSYRVGTQNGWDQEAWHVLSEMLPKAEKSAYWNEQHDAFLLSSYPLPTESDLAMEEAARIALEKANLKTVYENYVLMLAKDGQNIWKATVYGQDAQEKSRRITYEMDAKTGEILLEKDVSGAFINNWFKYVLLETYEKALEGTMTADDAMQLAKEALYSKMQDNTVPFDDENCYTADISYLPNQSRYTIRFRAKTLEYGDAMVWVNGDKTCDVRSFSAPGLTADNAYTRFQQVYGSANDWDQSIWQKLGDAVDALEATTMEGKLLKITRYPAADSVKLTRQDAMEVIHQNSQGVTNIIRMVLIDAQPNPVWKAYMWDDTGVYLVEVDANTGTITDKMAYKSDNYAFDNPLQIYTLHRDYAPMAVQEMGIEHMADIAITKEYGDMTLDEPFVPMTDESLYEKTVEGDSVTYTPKNAAAPAYTLTFTDGYTRYTIESTPGDPNQGGLG